MRPTVKHDFMILILYKFSIILICMVGLSGFCIVGSKVFLVPKAQHLLMVSERFNCLCPPLCIWKSPMAKAKDSAETGLRGWSFWVLGAQAMPRRLTYQWSPQAETPPAPKGPARERTRRSSSLRSPSCSTRKENPWYPSISPGSWASLGTVKMFGSQKTGKQNPKRKRIDSK